MNIEAQVALTDAEQMVADGMSEDAIDALVAAGEKFPIAGPIFAMLAPLAAAALRWDIAADAARQAIWLNESRPAGAVFPSIMPFTALTLDLNPRYQRRVAEQFVARTAPRIPRRRVRARDPKGPVRIGYLSADIRNHPVMHLGAALFECHDRSRFDVTCFSTGPPDDSVYRQRVIKSVDRFVDLHGMDGARASSLLRSADLDVVVDLSGHTQHSRTALLAHRPAPLQLSYLGYPGSTGAPFIDGFVGDAYVSRNQDHFTETLLNLPRYYQINDWATALAPTPSRASLGLPPDALVLCSFASAYKLEPTIVERWGRILSRVSNAVLWLLDPGPEPRRRLHAALGRHVDPDRILFAPPLERSSHLSRLGAADLCLDTYLVGGHTTTSDAVRAGLPVITCPRSPMISRVSASLLHQIAMPDLICADLGHYEQLAVALATDAQRLSGVGQRLRRNSMHSSVFNPADATAALEDLIMDVLRKRGTNVAA